ncbi:uncharacterized protein BDZ99DRAFT_461063 [Mytilinidion resinicola]|uniref:Uncharacterized protein n=1 Tax=Mytilinidion resinicola TaxID=574789 RepID=A0A6A6YU82_9PEZI|nr:uncharacterized protein BDZ99DRAFT_461063 [Mytilinidion resinicola]KAF2812341.1 hypothetical protein BDZ99DRAFT_461063 [Mytilinidion resinicola]
MATVEATTRSNNAYLSDSDDGQASGGRRGGTLASLPVPPTSSNLNQPAGSLVKGAVDEKGNLKDAALLLGIKLDLEAEIHLTARIRGDITIGLY